MTAMCPSCGKLVWQTSVKDNPCLYCGKGVDIPVKKGKPKERG